MKGYTLGTGRASEKFPKSKSDSTSAVQAHGLGASQCRLPVVGGTIWVLMIRLCSLGETRILEDTACDSKQLTAHEHLETDQKAVESEALPALKGFLRVSTKC